MFVDTRSCLRAKLPMTEHNHRRNTVREMPRGHEVSGHGFAPTDARPWGYLDKSLSSWHARGPLSDAAVSSKTIGNDFTKGHRGMAKSARGAKKFVRTRLRFHENAATKKLAREPDDLVEA